MHFIYQECKITAFLVDIIPFNLFYAYLNITSCKASSIKLIDPKIVSRYAQLNFINVKLLPFVLC